MKRKTCENVTKAALIFFGMITGGASAAQGRSVEVIHGSGARGTLIKNNCGRDVSFFSSANSMALDMANCYQANGDFFNPCTSKRGSVGPNTVQTVSDHSSDEKPIQISVLRFTKGDTLSPYSCDSGIRMLRDVSVNLDKPRILKRSQISVGPDGQIYDSASDQVIGIIPSDAYEQYSKCEEKNEMLREFQELGMKGLSLEPCAPTRLQKK